MSGCPTCSAAPQATPPSCSHRGNSTRGNALLVLQTKQQGHRPQGLLGRGRLVRECGLQREVCATCQTMVYQSGTEVVHAAGRWISWETYSSIRVCLSVSPTLVPFACIHHPCKPVNSLYPEPEYRFTTQHQQWAGVGAGFPAPPPHVFFQSFLPPLRRKCLLLGSCDYLLLAPACALHMRLFPVFFDLLFNLLCTGGGHKRWAAVLHGAVPP